MTSLVASGIRHQASGIKIDSFFRKTLRDRALRTTLLIGLLAAGSLSGAQGAEPHDDFQHPGEVNQVSLVMLVDERVVPRDLRIYYYVDVRRQF
jgi:hypothetical protein